MSATIKSGASTDELSIDPASKAARVTIYDSLGNEVKASSADRFFLPISLPVFAVLAANSYVWAMRNGGTKTINIDKVLLALAFSGVAAANVSQFELVRFTTANMSGGTAFALGSNVPKKTTTGNNSTLQDARYNGAAALVTTGCVFEVQPVMQIGISRAVTSQSITQWLDNLDINLLPNEGIALRATAATVVGDTVLGTIRWSEV